MTLLHGAWLDSALYIWGHRMPADDAAEHGSCAPPSASTAPAGNDESGVFDLSRSLLDVDELRDLLAECARDVLLVSGLKTAHVRLRVPDFNGAAGTVLIDAPSLVVDAADAVDLLTESTDPFPHAFSDSLRYWARLAEYAVSLVADKQFSPDIEQLDDGRSEAVWRPVIADREELNGLERFVAAAPPACLCVEAGAAQRDAVHVVERFLETAVDAVVRRHAAKDPFFADIHRREEYAGLGEVRWLSALLADDPEIRGDAEENAVLADRARGWVARLTAPADAETAQPAFTLCEPAADAPDVDSESAPWRVELAIIGPDGAVSDADFDHVWSERAGHPTLLSRRLGRRRDALLARLAEAEQVFPLLASAPHSRPPRVLDLSTQEAHRFIHEWAPLLESRGFEVNLPAWATKQGARLGLRLFVRPVSAGPGESPDAVSAMGLDSVVDFNWRVAVGDAELTPEEVERLVDRRVPLVRHRDQWLEIDEEAAREALAFMRSRGGGRITLLQALRIASEIENSDVQLPIVGISGESWIERLLSGDSGLADESMQSLAVPSTFNGTLRPYQRRGLDWLAFLDRFGIGGCLADDMGLGKTVQLIALLLHERAVGSNVGATLVFTPASVVGNWGREVVRFGPGLKVLVHHGPERAVGDEFVDAVSKYDVIITTYALGHRDRETLGRVRWHRIVLDEAQKIKNPHAAQTVSIRSLPRLRCVALTGTPLENHLSELWSIMDAVNPGLLGTPAAFRERFVIPIQRLGDQTRTEQLRNVLKPFVLRRLKTDPGVISDLPEKMEMRVYCNLTAEQAAWYQKVVDEKLSQIGSAAGIQRRGIILSMLTKLKQVCNHPSHYLDDDSPLDDRSGKCERLVEMLEEVLAEGDAALVFTQFRQMGRRLRELLARRLHTEPLFLHGGSSAKKRDEMIARFQDPEGGAPIFILSLRAGGLGINLTAATHVFHFDRWWNPAVENQATDRAHRVGQTRRVQVHKFVCIGTLEDRIDRLLEEKSALARSVIGSGDSWLTKLSTEELRDYVSLSRDAVG